MILGQRSLSAYCVQNLVVGPVMSLVPFVFYWIEMRFTVKGQVCSPSSPLLSQCTHIQVPPLYETQSKGEKCLLHWGKLEREVFVTFPPAPWG